LRDLHERISAALINRVYKRRVDDDRSFDILVGRQLNDWFRDYDRGQAARPDIWPYLTLVVLPEIAIARFGPNKSGRLPLERYAAGRRNIFHRLYLRSSILGDMLDDPELSLYEDELVGLVDRSLSSDHRLARLVSLQIGQLRPGGGRRETVRNALKSLQYEMRVTDVATLSDYDIQKIVFEIFDASRRKLVGESNTPGSTSRPS
jgi:hypothetical protein